MFCPNCKAEYQAGMTRCPNRGVPLVNSPRLPGDAGQRPAEGDAEKLRLLPVWSGDDPSEFAAAKAALEKAGIPFLDESREGYFLYPSFIPSFSSGLRVRTSTAPIRWCAKRWRCPLATMPQVRAHKQSADLKDGSDASENGEKSAEKKAAAEHPPEGLDKEGLAYEVWQGEDESMTETIVACFRENGIDLEFKMLFPHGRGS